MKKILIIDDDRLLTESLSIHFETAGYEVQVAGTSEEGIEIVKAFQPDIILLDIMVPEKNGLEVLKELSNSDASISKKIIMMTSLEDSAYLAKALEYGVKNYVTKSTTSPEAIVELVKAKLDENKD